MMHRDGESNSKIAAVLGIGKNTVNKYVAAYDAEMQKLIAEGSDKDALPSRAILLRCRLHRISIILVPIFLEKLGYDFNCMLLCFIIESLVNGLFELLFLLGFDLIGHLVGLDLVKDVIDFEQARNEKIQKDYDNDKKKSQRWMITIIVFHLIIPIASLIGLFRNGNSFAIFLLFFIVLIAPIILGALKPNNASRHGKGFFIILFYFTLIGAIIGFVYLRNFFMSNILG